MNEEIYTVKMDRPLGSAHPDCPAMVYPVNYGFIPGILGGDGEEQDAYVLGVDTPLDEFTGKRIAVIHRRDDDEDKWVMAPENTPFTKQQIEEMVYFQEQYYDSYVEMLHEELWDATDENENRLGYQVPRSMAKSLPEGVYHVVVMVYTLTADGRLLTTQRSRNKTYPLKWEVTGGSILAGETPRQGAVRELREETGICMEEQELEPLYDLIDAVRHCIYHSFIARVPCNTEVRLQEGETMDYQFLFYEDFKKLVRSERFVPSEQQRFLQREALMDKKLGTAVKKTESLPI